MNKFKVGDKVRVAKNLTQYDIARGWRVGDEFFIRDIDFADNVNGEVVYFCNKNGIFENALELVESIYNSSSDFGVDYITNTTDCNKWYIQTPPGTYPQFYQGETNNKTIMNKITTSIKRIFNSSLQKQYKAGLIDNCGNLTMSGEAELKSLLRDKFNDELTKVAEDLIKEEKE